MYLFGFDSMGAISEEELECNINNKFIIIMSDSEEILVEVVPRESENKIKLSEMEREQRLEKSNGLPKSRKPWKKVSTK